jgi:type 1 glutamine amidotransferase
MTAPSGRIDAYLVCGGIWHDFDFARLELLKLLAEDERVRVKVAEHYEDVDAMTAADFLVSYTCDVRPSEVAQQALRSWVEAGGRWFALHGTNSAIDPPREGGDGLYRTPRAFPVFAETLGSQFLSHPTIEPYPVTISPGAEDDPLVAGIETFDANDELYLCDYHGDLEPLLETRWTGTTRGFTEASWPDDEPRLVMYRRPLGTGSVLYLTLGHCRGHYDMVAPPHHGAYWPTVQRGSWEVAQFYELLRRGLSWAAAPARAAHAEAAQAARPADAATPGGRAGAS